MNDKHHFGPLTNYPVQKYKNITHSPLLKFHCIICFISQNKLGDTPLHSAAWKNHAEAVKLLIQKGMVHNVLTSNSVFNALVHI